MIRKKERSTAKILVFVVLIILTAIIISQALFFADVYLASPFSAVALHSKVASIENVRGSLHWLPANEKSVGSAGETRSAVSIEGFTADRDVRIFESSLNETVKHEIRCPATRRRSEKLDLIIFITSARANVKRRVAQRETWIRNIEQRGLQDRVAVFYAIGDKSCPESRKSSYTCRANDPRAVESADVSLDEALAEEQRTYGDIIFLDMIDTYYSLTLKVKLTLATLVKCYDFELAMKSDDDAWICPLRILQSAAYINAEMLLWSNFRHGYAVDKNVKSSNYNSIRKNTYEPFPSGGGYIVSRDFAQWIADSYESLREMPGEDVSMGDWAWAANANLLEDRRFAVAKECLHTLLSMPQNPGDKARFTELERNFDQCGQPCTCSGSLKPQPEPRYIALRNDLSGEIRAAHRTLSFERPLHPTVVQEGNCFTTIGSKNALFHAWSSISREIELTITRETVTRPIVVAQFAASGDAFVARALASHFGDKALIIAFSREQATAGANATRGVTFCPAPLDTSLTQRLCSSSSSASSSSCTEQFHAHSDSPVFDFCILLGGALEQLREAASKSSMDEFIHLLRSCRTTFVQIFTDIPVTSRFQSKVSPAVLRMRQNLEIRGVESDVFFVTHLREMRAPAPLRNAECASRGDTALLRIEITAPKYSNALRAESRARDFAQILPCTNSDAFSSYSMSALPSNAPMLPFDAWGYHTGNAGARNPLLRFTKRWAQIGAEIASDLSSGMANPAFTAIDIGSNEGFFSSSIAYSFPKSFVVSLDRNALYHGQKSQLKHAAKLKELRITNNALCEGLFDVELIDRLALRRQPIFRYSLTLSVFHWLPLHSKEEFHRVLAKHLQAAQTTFLELPEGGHAVSANYEAFSKWYSKGANISKVIEEVASSANMSIRVKFLGSNLIDYGPTHSSTTTREMYRIDLLPAAANAVEPQPATRNEQWCADLQSDLRCAQSLLCLPAAPKAPVLPFKPWGYHTGNKALRDPDLRFDTRWQQIGAEIAADIQANFTGAKFTAIDIGSNEGFFSAAVAHSFPGSMVVSLDRNAEYFGVRSQTKHSLKLRELNISNNALCEGSFDEALILRLAQWEQPVFDYSLTLSVFHWLPLPTKADFQRVLVRHLQLARTTFLELPEGGHEVSANYETFSRWYSAGDDVAQVIQEATQAFNVPVRLRHLGSNLIDYGPGHPSTTKREMYRIDMLADVKGNTPLVKYDEHWCSKLSLDLNCTTALHCTGNGLSRNNSSSISDKDGLQFVTAPLESGSLPHCDSTRLVVDWSQTPIGSGWSANAFLGSLTGHPVFVKRYSKAKYDASISTAFMAFQAHMGSRWSPGIVRPLFACRLDAATVLQVQPLVRGEALEKGLEHIDRDERVLSKLAIDVVTALVTVHSASFALPDMHPGQFVLANASNTGDRFLDPFLNISYPALYMIDLDQMHPVTPDGYTRCRCWDRNVCQGRVGCVSYNAPEALQNCEKQICNQKRDVHLFAQIMVYMANPKLFSEDRTLEDVVHYVAERKSSSRYFAIVAEALAVSVSSRPTSAELLSSLIALSRSTR